MIKSAIKFVVRGTFRLAMACSILVPLSALVSSSSRADNPFQQFCHGPSTPIEVLICNDASIEAVDLEMSIMFFSYLDSVDAGKRQSALDRQHAWQEERNSTCSISDTGGITAASALRSRVCVIDVYKSRLEELYSQTNIRINRLEGVPGNSLDDSDACFAILSRKPSYKDAIELAERLQHLAPYEHIEVFPPYDNNKDWAIVIAAYTDLITAKQSLSVASALAFGTDAYIWKMPNVENAHEWQPASADFNEPMTAVARQVVDCYTKNVAGDKKMTIFEMYQCSGAWVTPRTLISCSLGARCPALPDTIEGRAIINAELAEEKLSTDSPLELVASQIPRLPDAEMLTQCKSTSANEDEYSRCVSGKLLGIYKSSMDCFDKFTDGEKLACLSAHAGNKDYTALIGCLGGGRPTPDRIATCTSSANLEQDVAKIRDCIAGASGRDSARACLGNTISPPAKEAITCLSDSTAASQPLRCLDGLSPGLKNIRSVSDCLKQPGEGEAADCVAGVIGGQPEKIANCLKNKDEVATATCLIGDTPELRAAQRVEKCVQSGRDTSSIILNCTDGIIDEKSRQNIVCVTNAGGDRGKLASCAAGAVLPPDAARLVGCATNSDGPTSFALCAAGPSMNEEWRIVAECGLSTGGEPISFVSCTAGRLTVRELTKCFSGQIGKDCFGSNNTVVVTLTNAFRDVTKGPGKNNEVVKALRSVAELTGGPNSVINNPGQIWGGNNSVFRNPDQILGGSKSVFHDPGQVLDPSRWRF
jgi:uncharacterized protein YecT (DUF1311 family)